MLHPYARVVEPNQRYLSANLGAASDTVALVRPVVLPALGLWLLLWANINSGPWNFRGLQGVLSYVHAVRAALPFVVLPIALLLLCRTPRTFGLRYGGPVGLLEIYGVLALAASVLSRDPWYAFYWGFAFLAVCSVQRSSVGMDTSMASIRLLLLLTWVTVGLYTLGVIYVGRSVIIAGDSYGIVGAVGTVGDMPMSRSSGVARFAGVSAILVFIAMWRSRGVWLALWSFAWIGLSFIMYRMHSRGGLLAYLAALAFLCLFHRVGRKVVPVAVGLSVLAVLVQPELVNAVWEYLLRNGSADDLRSMTGRTYTWEQAWQVFLDSPFIGRGNWTDRFAIGQHVHNAFLQALLNAGLVGVVPYVASWILAWRYLLQLLKKMPRLDPRDQWCLLEAGAVLVFFTVRSIPETTTASFSVDLMVMVPVFTYLELAHRKYAEQASDVPAVPVLRPRTSRVARTCCSATASRYMDALSTADATAWTTAQSPGAPAARRSSSS